MNNTRARNVHVAHGEPIIHVGCDGVDGRHVVFFASTMLDKSTTSWWSTDAARSAQRDRCGDLWSVSIVDREDPVPQDAAGGLVKGGQRGRVGTEMIGSESAAQPDGHGSGKHRAQHMDKLRDVVPDAPTGQGGAGGQRTKEGGTSRWPDRARMDPAGALASLEDDEETTDEDHTKKRKQLAEDMLAAVLGKREDECGRCNAH